MDPSYRFEWSIAVVRGHADIMGFCQRGNLLGLQESTRIRNIGLNYVSCLALQKIEEAKSAVDVLSGGHAKRRSRNHLRHRIIVVRGDRFLAPAWVVGNHGPNRLERH